MKVIRDGKTAKAPMVAPTIGKRLVAGYFKWYALVYRCPGRAEVVAARNASITIDDSPADVEFSTPATADPIPTIYCIGNATCKSGWQRADGKFNSVQVAQHAIQCEGCYTEAQKLYSGNGGANGDEQDREPLILLEKAASEPYIHPRYAAAAQVLARRIKLFRDSGVMMPAGARRLSQRAIQEYTRSNAVDTVKKREHSLMMVTALARSGLPLELNNSVEFHRFLEYINSQGNNMYTFEERETLRSPTCKRVKISGFYGTTWLRTKGLDAASKANDEEIRKLILAEKHLVLAVDGYKQETKAKVLNVTMILPSSGIEVLLDCIKLDKHENAVTGKAAIIKVMDTLDEDTIARVCALVADNTACAVKALEDVRADKRFAHCVVLGCFAHRLALWAHDIADRFQPIVDDLSWLYSKISQRDSAAAALVKEAIELNIAHRTLLKHCPTRWGSLAAVTARFVALAPALQNLLTEHDEKAQNFQNSFGKPERNRLAFMLAKLQTACKKLNALLAPCAFAIFFMESASASAAFSVPVVCALEKDLKAWLTELERDEFGLEWFQYPTQYFNSKADASDPNTRASDWKPNYDKWSKGDPLFQTRDDVRTSLLTEFARRCEKRDVKSAYVPFLDDIHHLAFWFFSAVCPLKFLDGQLINAQTDRAFGACAAIKSAARQPNTEGNEAAYFLSLAQENDEELIGDLENDAMRRTLMLETQKYANTFTTTSALHRSFVEEMEQLKKRKGMSNVIFVEYQLTAGMQIVLNFWNHEYPNLPNWSPIVQRSALRVLSMVGNSASVERANSCMKSIQSKHRLRLGHDRTLQLTKLRFNVAAAPFKRRERLAAKRTALKGVDLERPSPANGVEQRTNIPAIVLDDREDDLYVDLDSTSLDDLLGESDDEVEDAGRRRAELAELATGDDDMYARWAKEMEFAPQGSLD